VKSSSSRSSRVRVLSARLRALQRISAQLISLREPRDLLNTIVRSAMDLLCCDAGSLYLAKDPGFLSFEVAMNDSVDFMFQKVKIPIDRPGIATRAFKLGHAYCVRDVYRIPKSLKDVIFDSSFDSLLGYRTRSVLVVPLKNSRGEILGVLQLLNKKTSSRLAWPVGRESQIQKMPSFDRGDLELMESFAAVAAASLENQGLYRQIEDIFESFVKAAVVAIDARDPGTRGHSVRVAHMTEALARAVSNSEDEDLRDVVFDESDLKELLWAGYVHDFGKIAVREATLQKDQKLTEVQRLRIQGRIHDFILSAQNDREQTRAEFEKVWQDILDLSQPSVLDTEAGVRLERLRTLSYVNSMGQAEKLLSEEDIESLSIKRGCLTPKEREEIESHVTQSYEFLKRIPWGPALKRIPEIAYCHHELLDGSGYPRGLKGSQIPVQSQIMTICDIFDALSAGDRAYKAALPLEKTLSILESMVNAGKLNARFYRVFKEKQIWNILNTISSVEPLLSTSKLAA
jgi:HD-GYP domain-containing protein (c-di-GMP phosphodiesterase class II)